jgi:3-oxoacyl-[acyl-carrier protein] reductase
MDLEVDVTDPSGIAVAVGQVASHWQRLDALICCAGLTADGLLLDLAPEDWTSVLTVNLKGASFCAQAVLPQMQHQQSGHIIFVGSYSARAGSAGQANYAAAKAGLIGLTQSLARETAPDNIRVNAVLPGILATGMTAKLSARRWRQLVDQNLLRRANDLGEASRFIVVLAGMRNVSGQVLQIDSRLARWT